MLRNHTICIIDCIDFIWFQSGKYRLIPMNILYVSFRDPKKANILAPGTRDSGLYCPIIFIIYKTFINRNIHVTLAKIAVSICCMASCPIGLYHRSVSLFICRMHSRSVRLNKYIFRCMYRHWFDWMFYCIVRCIDKQICHLNMFCL